jgi:hypothetical protein
MKLDNIKDKIDKFFESEAVQQYFEDLTKKQKIINQRYKRFEEWLKTNDFDKLMYRLINEYNDEYIEKCYHEGRKPYPNNKLIFIINYVTRNDAAHPVNVKKLKCDFPNDIWKFKGYYFQFIYGQGTLIRIYNKDDMRLLLEL